MPDFSHSLRDAIEADARAHLGAEALPGTRRAIARRRRAAAAGYGAGSALAVGGLAVGGVLLAAREVPPPASAASTSPTPTSEAPLAYTTIDLTGEDEILSGTSVEREYCGKPVPEPRSADGDFAATFDMIAEGPLEQVDSAPTGTVATASVTAALDDKLPAFISDLEGLVVQDGTVVGVLPGNGMRGWRMFADGGEVSASLDWWGFVVSCDDESDGRLEGGDYELVLSMAVTASEREAALNAVERAGLQLAGGEMVDVLTPGSWECERYSDDTGPSFLNCDVTALPGTSIDREAGTITIPYEASTFQREVDARMYSEPIPVTITDYVDGYAQQRAEAGPTLTGGEVPACGSSYGWIEGGEVALDTRTSLGTLEAGDTLEAGVWVAGTAWTEASVSLPSTPRAWLFEGHDVPLDDTSSLWALRVVGWLDLEAQDGPDVDLTRYDGPQPWPLTVTDVTWCEGVDSPSVEQAAILAEHTVVDDAGTRTSTDPISLGGYW